MTMIHVHKDYKDKSNIAKGESEIGYYKSNRFPSQQEACTNIINSIERDQIIQLMHHPNLCHYDDEWFEAYENEIIMSRMHYNTARGFYEIADSCSELDSWNESYSRLRYRMNFSAIKTAH